MNGENKQEQQILRGLGCSKSLSHRLGFFPRESEIEKETNLSLLFL